MYIIRYGEIALKGKNRIYFENKLKENIKIFLNNKGMNYTKLERKRGRILLFTEEDCGWLKNIFGITSISRATKARADINDIKTSAYNLIKNKRFNSFKINAKRLTKDFKLGSMQINNELGDFIKGKTKKKVNLDNPGLEIGVEIIEDNAYIFDNKVNCFGGLPVGTQGKVIALIQDRNSLVVCFLMMKRGCSVKPVAFKEKDITLLKKFSPYPLNLRIIKNIKDIENIDEKARALVVSQTLKNFNQIETGLPILRPLVGFSRKDIEELYDKMKNT